MSLGVPYGVRLLFVHAVLLMTLGLAAPAQARDIHILAFGDSLTAGYGLPRGQGYAPQLEDALRRNGVRAFVTDAGVSGNTAAQGRARLDWTLDGLSERPDLAIVALGGNDMLRGLTPRQTRADLDAIVAELQRRGIKVLVAGMVAAPNLGARYASEFNPIFAEVAGRRGAEFYPIYLANVAGDPKLNLPDRVHPNFQGIKRMVSGILPSVLGALAKVRT